jgi:hypothetical protein
MDLGNIKKLLVVEIALLFIQFGLGMFANLFVDIPLNAPFNFFGYTDGLLILAHIVNGSLILFFGFTIIWFSYKAKDLLIRILPVLSVVLTIIAITCGIVFLEIFSFPSLYNNDNYFSLAMAMSFLCVFTVLFSELYASKKAQKSKIEEETS